MDIYTRVENLENLVNNLIETINNSKFYTDADIAGVRKGVSELTPYVASAEAFYGEKEKTFYNVPQGNLLVFFDAYAGSYTVERIADRLTIKFPEALQSATNITITIQ